MKVWIIYLFGRQSYQKTEKQLQEITNLITYSFWREEKGARDGREEEKSVRQGVQGTVDGCEVEEKSTKKRRQEKKNARKGRKM